MSSVDMLQIYLIIGCLYLRVHFWEAAAIAGKILLIFPAILVASGGGLK